MERIFKRRLYEQMLKWKVERQGKTALLIKGARRVGKSTLVEDFARREYASYIFIDFSTASKEVKDLFNDISDLDYIFLRLQMAYHVDLIPRQSVIVFDEVQTLPLARQAIKHLVKDGRYDYIETGSLLSIKRNVKSIVIPSEETRLSLYPMDYEEFKWALGDDVSIRLLYQSFEKRQSLGDAMNRRLMRDFRLYMLVGGMPQAVNAYIETNNLGKVDEVKREILDLYEDDLWKIESNGRASALFNAIPSELSKNAARYQVSSVDSKLRTSEITELIATLADSHIINIAYHANDPNVGMSLSRESGYFKMYVHDTGLFVTLAFRDRSFTENVIYEKLLNDKLSTNLGYVYENMIAQTLRASGNELFYYTFPTGKNDNHYYEVDFLLSRGDKICPIEVKSSGYKTHTSLTAFCEKYSSRIKERYLVYTKDLRKEGEFLYVPAYMTLFL